MSFQEVGAIILLPQLNNGNFAQNHIEYYLILIKNICKKKRSNKGFKKMENINNVEVHY